MPQTEYKNGDPNWVRTGEERVPLPGEYFEGRTGGHIWFRDPERTDEHFTERRILVRRAMKTYEIKIRVFPSPRQGSWGDGSDASDWDWQFDTSEVSYETVYARPVTDERMRDGFSVKMKVTAPDEYGDPATWDWGDITETEAERVDFISATEKTLKTFNPTEPSHCLQCAKRIPRGQGWRDKDGDVYCSYEHLKEYLGNDYEHYAVGPTGIEYHLERA